MIHLNHNPSGTFKWSHAIDGNDIHFAVRVTDFEEFIKHLTDASFYETDDVDDPNRMIIKRSGPAGFPQVYVRDPDGNIIEINGATLPLLEGL